MTQEQSPNKNNNNNNNNNNVNNKTRKVLIVGSGAAGTAAAWCLAQNPNFSIQVWEAASQAGGVATSEEITTSTSSSSQRKFWINDGVQGGSPTYRNTLWLHEQVGIQPRPVKFRVSFGKNETAWNNTTSTPLVQRLQPDIIRFGSMLRWIKRFMPLSGLIPIGLLLRFGRFSRDFRDHMLYPLVALFFGTGNQTRHVSSALIASVFLDDKLRLFDYDTRRLLSQQPRMFAFDKLDDIYKALVDAVERTGRATFYFERPVVHVERESDGRVIATDGKGKTEQFHDVIFACPADVALRALSKPSYWERQVLGAVRYFHDVTVTHTDRAYMEKYYEIDDSRGDQYFIRTYPDATDRIEMSFDLSNYQEQISSAPVYQTIFLDRARDERRWTDREIDPDRVLFAKPWIQFSHTWKHYARVVPWMRFLQGRRNTYYAGSWTLANTHEIATVSGFAAAYRLGAQYPVTITDEKEKDELALDQFKTYLNIVHGVRYEGDTKKKTESVVNSQQTKDKNGKKE